MKLFLLQLCMLLVVYFSRCQQQEKESMISTVQRVLTENLESETVDTTLADNYWSTNEWDNWTFNGTETLIPKGFECWNTDYDKVGNKTLFIKFCAEIVGSPTGFKCYDKYGKGSAYKILAQSVILQDMLTGGYDEQLDSQGIGWVYVETPRRSFCFRLTKHREQFHKGLLDWFSYGAESHPASALDIARIDHFYNTTDIKRRYPLLRVLWPSCKQIAAMVQEFPGVYNFDVVRDCIIGSTLIYNLRDKRFEVDYPFVGTYHTLCVKPANVEDASSVC